MDDVLIAPAALYARLAAYTDPLEFAAADPVVTELAARRRADLATAVQLPPWRESASGALFVLPDEGWSRRVLAASPTCLPSGHRRAPSRCSGRAPTAATWRACVRRWTGRRAPTACAGASAATAAPAPAASTGWRQKNSTPSRGPSSSTTGTVSRAAAVDGSRRAALHELRQPREVGLGDGALPSATSAVAASAVASRCRAPRRAATARRGAGSGRRGGLPSSPRRAAAAPRSASGSAARRTASRLRRRPRRRVVRLVALCGGATDSIVTRSGGTPKKCSASCSATWSGAVANSPPSAYSVSPMRTAGK